MDLKSLGWHWEKFARTDPLWAIITWPEKKGGKWDPAEFFATGRREIGDVMTYLAGLGLAHVRRRALDFGCGAGRLTQALADHYEGAVGLDISPTMVRLARRYNRFGKRCRYVINRRSHLACLEGDGFDLIYTNIVLQHMEPRYSLGYVREFLRFLTPPGVLVFQLPSQPLAQTTGVTVVHDPIRPTQRERLAARAFGRPVQRAVVSELYTVPEPTVREIVRANGGRVVDVQENDAAGPGHRSLRYCVVRAGG
jgi:SAM-dependent methyltransferase